MLADLIQRQVIRDGPEDVFGKKLVWRLERQPAGVLLAALRQMGYEEALAGEISAVIDGRNHFVHHLFEDPEFIKVFGSQEGIRRRGSIRAFNSGVVGSAQRNRSGGLRGQRGAAAARSPASSTRRVQRGVETPSGRLPQPRRTAMSAPRSAGEINRGRSRGIPVHRRTACQSEQSQPVAADPARPSSEMRATGVGG